MFVWTGLATAGDCLYISAFLRQYDSKNYLQTSGVITQREIKHLTRTIHMGVGHGIAHYTNAVIQYSYEVNGQPLKSNRYRYLPDYSAQQIADNYPKGSKVVVFYNPANPQEAVLSPGISDLDWDVLYIVAFLNSILAFFWGFAWVKFRQKKKV